MADDDPTPTAPQLADQAAEALRALNHATRSGRGGLTYPADAYDTIGSLETLVTRIPQAIQQIQTFIDQLDAAGNLRSDKGPDDLAERLDLLRTALTQAVQQAPRLHASLGVAHSALSLIAWQD